MKKINDVASADALLLAEIGKREKALAKASRASGKDEAVVAAASRRDCAKFIPRRMN
jgi:hypothetical protein